MSEDKDGTSNLSEDEIADSTPESKPTITPEQKKQDDG